MRTRTAFLVVAALLAAVTLSTQPTAQADTFGSGTNTFTIDFVNIGNAGNAAQSASNRSHTNSGGDGRGSVPYEYRMGTYEITEDAITKATAGGLSNVPTVGTNNRPAGYISWYQAAAFVNWLNTSKGYSAAYNLTNGEGMWSITLWSSANAWKAGGTNRFRHKDAFYFLPSEDEWFKAAYYNPAGSNYFLYPTASDTAPTAVASGTNAGTAVYKQTLEQGPSGVGVAGALSSYGTMGQGGNAMEWNESAFDGTNNVWNEARTLRGGSWQSFGFDQLSSSSRGGQSPSVVGVHNGFRVASVASVLPQIVSASNGLSGFSMTWTPASNVNVQRRLDLNEGAWTTILSNSVGTNYVDEATPAGRAFYRLAIP